MSATRTERLLNLVIALRATSRLRSKSQLRRDVPGYAEAESDDAFDRMFERDKEELRELGIPLVTGALPGGFEDEVGYRIDPDAYALPQIQFTPVELAMLSLAAKAWAQARLSGVAGRALTKLRALGEEPDEAAILGVEPRVGTAEPAFDAVYHAVRDSALISFSYRASGGGRSTQPGKVTQRVVEPWRLTSWHGRWYLVGYDRMRESQRAFRVSRIEGKVSTVRGDTNRVPVPQDLAAAAAVAAVFDGPSVVRVRVDLAPDRGQLLRRDGEPATTEAPTVPGYEPWWIQGRSEQVVADVAALGADGVLVSPEPARAAVVRLLEGAAQAHRRPAPEPVLAEPARARTPRGSGHMEPAGNRLSRLLAEVPFLLEHPGIAMEDAARHFGITEATLVKDLELLFVCGLPGHLPDDLIEAEWEDGRIFLRNADAIAEPLRLSTDEAITLLVGLRMLRDAPGSGDLEALDGALQKLSAASEDASRAAAAVQITVETAPQEAELLERLRAAVRDHRQLHLRYLVPSRDEHTERDVNPMRVLAISGRWYMEAWCLRAQAVRMFRLDRIVTLAETGRDGTPPDEAGYRDLSGQPFQPNDAGESVEMWLEPAAKWVNDYYFGELLAQAGEASYVRVLTSDLSWVQRLALRLGGDARIVKPSQLADRVVQAAQEALRNYR